MLGGSCAGSKRVSVGLSGTETRSSRRLSVLIHRVAKVMIQTKVYQLLDWTGMVPGQVCGMQTSGCLSLSRPPKVTDRLWHCFSARMSIGFLAAGNMDSCFQRWKLAWDPPTSSKTCDESFGENRLCPPTLSASTTRREHTGKLITARAGTPLVSV